VCRELLGQRLASLWRLGQMIGDAQQGGNVNDLREPIAADHLCQLPPPRDITALVPRLGWSRVHGFPSHQRAGRRIGSSVEIGHQAAARDRALPATAFPGRDHG
jgi:hypothetical protein